MTWAISYHPELNSRDKGAVGSDIAISHARGVEGEAGVALTIQKNKATGGVRAFAEKMNGFARGEMGRGYSARSGVGRIHTGGGAAEEIDGYFGHDDLHDGFAVAGRGGASCFRVGVAAAADERRVADAAGKFATGAASGCSSEELAVAVDGYRADGTLLMAAVMLGGVLVLFTFHPSFPLGRTNEIFGIAKGNALFLGVALGALGNEHHVVAMFEDLAGEQNRILDPLETGSGTGAERGAVHDHGVAFHATVEIEMRAVAGIENRVVFEDNDGGFYGVERGTALGKN